jgi:hypothetical protein
MKELTVLMISRVVADVEVADFESSQSLHSDHGKVMCKGTDVLDIHGSTGS